MASKSGNSDNYVRAIIKERAMKKRIKEILPKMKQYED